MSAHDRQHAIQGVALGELVSYIKDAWLASGVPPVVLCRISKSSSSPE